MHAQAPSPCCESVGTCVVRWQRRAIRLRSDPPLALRKGPTRVTEIGVTGSLMGLSSGISIYTFLSFHRGALGRFQPSARFTSWARNCGQTACEILTEGSVAFCHDLRFDMKCLSGNSTHSACITLSCLSLCLFPRHIPQAPGGDPGFN